MNNNRKTRRQYIIFNIGNEEYAIEIDNAREITKRLKITQIPEANENVLGVVNLRGEVFSVIDLHSLLETLEDSLFPKENERIITVEMGYGLVGFLVDNISGLKTIDSEKIKEAPQILNQNAFIEGIYVNNEDNNKVMFIILDLTNFLKINMENVKKEIKNIKTAI